MRIPRVPLSLKGSIVHAIGEQMLWQVWMTLAKEHATRKFPQYARPDKIPARVCRDLSCRLDSGRLRAGPQIRPDYLTSLDGIHNSECSY